MWGAFEKGVKEVMPLKVNYGDMTPAVRKSLEKKVKDKCPGGELCPFPDLLCTECKFDNSK